MSAAKLIIAVEPFESGKVVYLPMAAATSKKKARGRVLLRIDITNNEAATVDVTSVTLSFPGSNVAPEAKVIGKKIQAGKSLRWFFAAPADDILFDLPGPSSVSLSFACVGFSPATVVTHPLAPHASPVAGGAYLFPGHADDLKVGEFWSVNGCTHGMGFEGSQSFAYDMGMLGVDHDSGDYSDKLPVKDGTQNSHFRVWGKPVRAMADGVVLETVNDCPNNPAPLTWADDADLQTKLKKQKDNYWEPL